MARLASREVAGVERDGVEYRKLGADHMRIAHRLACRFEELGLDVRIEAAA